ncbi:MAG: carbohydrate ABC transporter permease [Actinobacteria bacterium]|nr:carbohydrate ABC transporter permease [Actinomycetota bacterium]
MMKGRKIQINKNYPALVGRQIMMFFLVVLSLFPVFFMLNTALKSKEDYIDNRFGFPQAIAWDNFREVFLGKNFSQWFFNSIILTVVSVAVSLIIALLAAFALSRYKFKMREGILKFVISLMMVPPVIMIIPLFIFMSRTGLTNSYIGINLIYSGLLLPFSIYLLTTFFRSIPQSIIESAYIDGCSSIRILRNILIPMSMPPIMTLIVINALWVWNELLLALVFLQKDQFKTLMTGITVFKSRYNVNIPLTMMGLVIVTIPMVLIYFLAQKYFIRGLVSGSLKE